MAELPNPERKLDPTRTYQSVMVEMRKKKWGLNQRVNYESELSRNTDSRVNAGQSQPKSPEHEHKIGMTGDAENGENKIVVNSRLKQFLFE